MMKNRPHLEQKQKPYEDTNFEGGGRMCPKLHSSEVSPTSVGLTNKHIDVGLKLTNEASIGLHSKSRFVFIINSDKFRHPCFYNIWMCKLGLQELNIIYQSFFLCSCCLNLLSTLCWELFKKLWLVETKEKSPESFNVKVWSWTCLLREQSSMEH